MVKLLLDYGADIHAVDEVLMNCELYTDQLLTLLSLSVFFLPLKVLGAFPGLNFE